MAFEKDRMWHGFNNTYHVIKKITPIWPDNKLKITMAIYHDEDSRVREKIAAAESNQVSEWNFQNDEVELAEIDCSSIDRAVIYPAIKAQIPEYADAEDLIVNKELPTD